MYYLFQTVCNNSCGQQLGIQVPRTASLDADLSQRSVAKVSPAVFPYKTAKLCFDVAPMIEVWREGRGVKSSTRPAIDNLKAGIVGSVSEQHIFSQQSEFQLSVGTLERRHEDVLGVRSWLKGNEHSNYGRHEQQRPDKYPVTDRQSRPVMMMRFHAHPGFTSAA